MLASRSINQPCCIWILPCDCGARCSASIATSGDSRNQEDRDLHVRYSGCQCTRLYVHATQPESQRCRTKKGTRRSGLLSDRRTTSGERANSVSRCRELNRATAERLSG